MSCIENQPNYNKNYYCNGGGDPNAAQNCSSYKTKDACINLNSIDGDCCKWKTGSCPLLNQSCEALIGSGSNKSSCSDVKTGKASFIKGATMPLLAGGMGCSKSDAEKVYNKSYDCACGGLSTGAIVGIVIGSLAFIAIVVFIVLRMRKKKGKRRKK